MKNFLFIAMREAEGFREEEQKVMVNSLGSAGTLAVKRQEDLELIKKHGPLYILE